MVGPSETVDAGQVMSVLDLLDREALREGLACSLLRRPTHRATFDAVFDLWFPKAIGDRAVGDVDVTLPRKPDGSIDLQALRELIAELLTDGSDEAMEMTELLTAAMVEELGQYQSSNGPSFSAYQALRDVAPETLLNKILQACSATRRVPGQRARTTPTINPRSPSARQRSASRTSARWSRRKRVDAQPRIWARSGSPRTAFRNSPRKSTSCERPMPNSPR